MDADWTKSPAGERIQRLDDDPRPAWLWTVSGDKPVWANRAARLFLAKKKKGTLRLAAEAIPIRGQIARVLRLGAPGRTSLSRLQFLSGSKPAAATCHCTPLPLDGDEQALLVVGVDPIDRNLIEAYGEQTAERENEFVPTAVTAAGREVSGQYPRAEPEEPPAGDGPAIRAEADTGTNEDRDEETLEPGELTGLIDRLAGDEDLFAPLGSEDDTPPDQTTAPDELSTDAEAGTVKADTGANERSTDDEPDLAAPAMWRVVGRGFKAIEPGGDIDEGMADAPGLSDASDGPDAPLADQEGIVEVNDGDAAGEETTNPNDAPASKDMRGAGRDTPDALQLAHAERVTRYNFDELSRILTHRVANTVDRDVAASEPAEAAPAASGDLISLSDETLVLNRLALGILVFRDQAILFANRAFAELTGHGDTTSLRARGLKAVFPEIADDAEAAGPVTRLTRQDGASVPVEARLQTISWRGQPALMLSALARKSEQSGEASLRGFARELAGARGEGFVSTGRTGVIGAVSALAAKLLANQPLSLIGQPLARLCAPEDAGALRRFLEKPGRLAETKRPAINLGLAESTARLVLMAEGRAGIVEGYFGFVVPNAGKTGSEGVNDSRDVPALLARISRGVRRPLNTVIGFSELIGSTAFGPIKNSRYVEYARDIKSAGSEIAGLVDEVDEYTRLQDGRYSGERTDIELAALLDECMRRVRSKAGAARVLVRSAISEKLPRVRADRPSLEQALLNLLASAIDQTPEGGQVVMSAQWETDGSILIHVRDTAALTSDFTERFVVFRDGVGRDGQIRVAGQSSIGWALTRTLLAVNACTLSVDPSSGTGTLMSLTVPAEMTVRARVS